MIWAKKTTQASITKVFQTKKTKLDDLIASNIKLPVTKRRQLKKGEVPNYGIDIDDEVPDMNLGDSVLTQQKNNLYQNHQRIKNRWKRYIGRE